ncbi:hypothetical protein ACSFA3_02170 [Variovorax sp. RHLX14]|uniref:hypothetical protein n=1 Tax=Variovorax sp. RHLX14 TaxID=1259731 RepID=UPI003F454460
MGENQLAAVFNARIIYSGEKKIVVAFIERVDDEWPAQEQEVWILSHDDKLRPPRPKGWTTRKERW